LFTDVKFEYGLTTEYDTSINATPDKVTGSSNTNINAFVSKLEPGTIYHFTVKAINSLGTTYGSDSTFTTLGNKPLVTTSSASSIFGKSATLNGIVNANYLSTDVKFEYGLTTKYDKSIKATPDKVTGNSTAIVSADLSDLSPETTYHFRVLATNSLGTTYGNDSTLITVKRENNPNHDEPADGRTQPH
jgi:hypothetical protein